MEMMCYTDYSYKTAKPRENAKRMKLRRVSPRRGLWQSERTDLRQKEINFIPRAAVSRGVAPEDHRYG